MAIEQIFHEFIQYALAQKLPIEGVAIADEKKVICEYHFVPDLARNTYSHTKSYMATAIGIAISEGKLSLEDRLADFFPEAVPEHADERLFRITLRNLLTMSSGFNRPYLMNADRRSGVGAPDYMAYMMSRPFEKEPGETFCYSTADSILAGRMLEKAVGMRMSEYLFHHVFSKLGQGFPLWENDPQGHPIGGGGMHMKLTDMMKLLQVYLAGGMWQGERIVDAAWVKEATRKQIDTPKNDQDIWNGAYGYQFWMSPYPGAYRADGAYGQISTALPEKGLVIAVQAPEVGNFDIVRQALHEYLFTQI